MRVENSEVKFIEWTTSRKKNSYDSLLTVGAINSLLNKDKKIGLDIGGGIGTFSLHISLKTDSHIDVVDPSLLAKKNFLVHNKLNLISEDFREFNKDKKYDFIFLNFVLHHILGDDLGTTKRAQMDFIEKTISYLNDDGILIVEELYYNGMFGSDITGQIIYQLTKLKCIEKFTRFLGANTAGEGVRFRSNKSWNKLFQNLGLIKIAEAADPNWGKKFSLHKILLLLIGSNRFQSISIFKKSGSKF